MAELPSRRNVLLGAAAAIPMAVLSTGTSLAHEGGEHDGGAGDHGSTGSMKTTATSQPGTRASLPARFLRSARGSTRRRSCATSTPAP